MSSFLTPFHARLLWSVADSATDAALRHLFPDAQKPSVPLSPPALFLDPANQRIVCVTTNRENGARPNAAGFHYSRSESLWWTRDLRKAAQLADIAEPALARRLQAIGRLPFDVLTAVTVADLVAPTTPQAAEQLAAVEQATLTRRRNRGAASPGSDGDDAPDLALTYDRDRKIWLLDDPATARWHGFTQDPVTGAWVTPDPTCVAPLRRHANDLAEVAIQQRTLNTLPPRPKPPYLPIPTPPGFTLAPEQIEAVYLAATRPGLLIGDEMGVGKTPTALGIINLTAPLNALVVCPAKLAPNWLAESHRWLLDRDPIIWRPPRRRLSRRRSLTATPPLEPQPDPQSSTPPFPARPRLVIVSFDTLPRAAELLATEWDIVIVDEVQECLNPRSRRGRALYGHIRARRRIAMSGTPIWNRPQDLWAVLNWIAPEVFPDRAVFQRLYGVTDIDDVSDAKKRRLDFLASLLRGTPHRPPLMIRRLKADVLASLPPKTRELVCVPVPPEVLATLSHASARVESLVTESRAGSMSLARRAHMLSEIARLRKATAEAKLPFIEAELRRRLTDPDPLILFGSHRHIVRHLYHVILAGGATAILINGDVTARARQVAVDRFQAGGIQVAVGGLDAAGVGLTLTRAAEIWIVEMDFTPAKLQQAEDRVHRRGQVRPVLIRYIVVDKTIDARIARAVIAKTDLAATALGDHVLGFDLDDVVLTTLAAE